MKQALNINTVAIMTIFFSSCRDTGRVCKWGWPSGPLCTLRRPVFPGRTRFVFIEKREPVSSIKNKVKIIVKAALAILMAAGFLGASSALACCRNYAEFAAQCRSEGGIPSGPPARCDAPSRGGNYDNGAAHRAQAAAAAAAAAEAERQRQAEAARIEQERLAEEARLAEEKRKRDAEFIRDRDAAAGTLKGSSESGGALSQLKGMTGADSSGLKGSGFDSGGSSLKELKGSDHVGSQSETTRASLNGSIVKAASRDGGKNKELCPPTQDPSVVDLCFLGGKPKSIDPRILKGMSPADKAILTTSANNMTQDLLSFDKEIVQSLADMLRADPAKTGKQWPGPSNPGTRYLNPLSEPEKVKAYWDKVNAGLHTHAEAQAKIMKATPKGFDWREVVARQEADPKFMQSKDQILRNQDKAEVLARKQMFTKFTTFLEKQGGADWPDRIKNDKLFAARMVMEREMLFKKMDQEIYGVRANSLKQMTVLVKEWKAQ